MSSEQYLRTTGIKDNGCQQYLLLFNRFPHNDPLVTPLGNKPFKNTVGKGEIAHNEQFLLFPQCFLPIWITFCHFRQI